jgi:beta-aspartyl-peptidase (threonine type)
MRILSRSFSAILGILLFGIAAVAAFSVAQGQPGSKTPVGHSDASSWKTPIQEVLDAQVAAWNRGDIDGFLSGYWNSPDFVYVGNKRVVRGWSNARDFYYQSLRTPDGKTEPMGILRLDETQFASLGPEAALVWGTYTVAIPGQKPYGGFYTLVLRKFPEGWRTIYDRTSSATLQN